MAASSGDSKVHMLTGNPTIVLVMAVLEDIAIVWMCLGTDLTLSAPVVTSDQLFVRQEE
ncbi:hypothetical protein PENANT_c033G00810 [Penicillium antarcticum]|uniref:DUF7702 domain-containing protein n=1 Tax=Penicillium antarcticum TaxID=416450 RepID=A0A1V6PVI6_9EURO|nr:uncharacterized protein N7508_000837 [Penicillium antarcticum]KAJ5320554.1 hypothetical protein N7508_000837 [Penicillium antarcticum]OQD80722.1 hypothetical protein PENANT_c033G00810 [Penicillium antarcticum]